MSASAMQCGRNDAKKFAICAPSHNLSGCSFATNVMAALLNIDGALCSMPQSLANVHY